MENLKSEINKIIEYSKNKGKKIKDHEAFNILILKYICYGKYEMDDIWIDINECITDGSNDGGIDFVFYDEESEKIIIGQNKYSESVSKNDLKSEISKVKETIENFYSNKTGRYSQKLKKNLQNAIDRLSDENSGNIDYYFSSLNKFKRNQIEKDIEGSKIDDIRVFSADEIIECIEKVNSDIDIVKEEVLFLDKTKNYLEYESDDKKGVFVNIKSGSLIEMYNKHSSSGLFNLNIRKYIRNKSVDDKINETLKSGRKDFWFLNNGITIACSDYTIDGDKVKLYNFSIVNGGQTTTLIGKYAGSNNEEFIIPCKIIKSINSTENTNIDFYGKIAEATNSQKPIQPRDLKSNAREMIELRNFFSENNISFEIKRGVKGPKKNEVSIKNTDFAQVVFSFVNQRPGTARSNTKSLFDNNTNYEMVFKKGYMKNEEKKEFILDIVDLNKRYTELVKDIKNGNRSITENQMVILSNGKMVLFAIFGILYRLVNEDINLDKAVKNPNSIKEEKFIYGRFISNYKKDDIEERLFDGIKLILGILEDEYEKSFEKHEVTSVSNYFKTDLKYNEAILGQFFKSINRSSPKKELFDEENGYANIFKR